MGDYETVMSLTCPHLVILGAVGGERQIGQTVTPSSGLVWSLGPEVDANADVRGTMTWRTSGQLK